MNSVESKDFFPEIKIDISKKVSKLDILQVLGFLLGFCPLLYIATKSIF